MSLGVLKGTHATLFEPTLPELKRTAIEGIGFGTADKIYLEFDPPFWSDDFRGVSLLWNAEDLNEMRKRYDSWIEGVLGLFTVDSQPNLLCGWISGEKARQMEIFTDEDVLHSMKYLLRTFLKNSTDPKSMKRSTWSANPHFRGSYSHWSVNQDKLNVTPADLAEPLIGESGKLKVLFAGEATSSHHFSTGKGLSYFCEYEYTKSFRFSVHGAIETGWREANRIIDSYNEVNNE